MKIKLKCSKSQIQILLKNSNVTEKNHLTLENFNINNEPLNLNYYCKLMFKVMIWFKI